MIAALTTMEFNLLRLFIEQECGIAITEEKMYLVENRLAQLVEETGCSSYGEFYQAVKVSNDSKLREKIVDAMTTNETLWFRDDTPYRTLSEYLLPEFEKRMLQTEQKSIRIWSAACSTGQEPYSITMTILEYARTHPSQYLWTNGFSIMATDISQSVLMLAKLGRYNDIAMSRGMRQDMQDRYFTKTGRIHVISDEVRKYVEFQKFNLMDSFSSLGRYDLVFLRNVAIYFAFNFKVKLFERIAEILRPEGYLILGSSESLYGITDLYDLRSLDKASVYQLKG